jgi:spermidine synthase
MRRVRCIALAALLVALAAPVAAETVLHTERSLYRQIIVYEDGDLRCMRFTRVATARQSCQSRQEPRRLVFEYLRMMMGALYFEPAPRRVLVIGLGGGSLVNALESVLPAARIDAVEVDPAVVRVARQYFGFAPGNRVEVHELDGRVFVKRALRAGRTYDLVMLDAYDHEYIPEHLLTREFLEEVKQVMMPGGVLAANTFSSSRLYDHESATYAAVFGPFYNLKRSNRVIMVRRDRLPPLDVLERNAQGLDRALAPLGVESTWLLPQFVTTQDWPADTRVLTDRYSPSNLLNAERP